MMLLKVLLACICVCLASCRPVDPSARDMKSPCVGKESSKLNTPCIKRIPIQNSNIVFV